MIDDPPLLARTCLYFCAEEDGAEAALIVKVLDEETVNIAVFDREFARPSVQRKVRFVRHGDETSMARYCCYPGARVMQRELFGGGGYEATRDPG